MHLLVQRVLDPFLVSKKGNLHSPLNHRQGVKNNPKNRALFLLIYPISKVCINGLKRFAQFSVSLANSRYL